MTDKIKKLLEQAQAILQNSYCPYSRFQVAAVLMTENGKMVSGVNVENASYGLTNCAERTALFSAVAQGYRHFTDILIFAPESMPYPCGACRQVLCEFVDNNFNIHVATVKNGNTVLESYTFEELFPKPFIN